MTSPLNLPYVAIASAIETILRSRVRKLFFFSLALEHSRNWKLRWSNLTRIRKIRNIELNPVPTFSRFPFGHFSRASFSSAAFSRRVSFRDRATTLKGMMPRWIFPERKHGAATARPLSEKRCCLERSEYTPGSLIRVTPFSVNQPFHAYLLSTVLTTKCVRVITAEEIGFFVRGTNALTRWLPRRSLTIDISILLHDGLKTRRTSPVNIEANSQMILWKEKMRSYLKN